MFDYFRIARFFLYLVPLFVVIVSGSTLFPFIVGKYVFFRTVVALAFIFFLLAILFDDKKLAQVKANLRGLIRQPLIVAVSVFAFIFVVAGFFGVDPAYSFWSNFERGEGGLQMIHLWLFFALLILLFREEKNWQKLFIVAIIGGLGMALYGFLAGIGFQGVIGPKFGSEGFRFSGSIGNSAYVASYAIFMIFYLGYLLVSRSNSIRFASNSYKSTALYFLIALFIVVFFAAATRGAFVGLLAALIAGIGYFAYSKKEWRKWLLASILILLVLVSVLVFFRNTPLVKAIPGSRIFELSVSAETWRHRTYMWKTAFDGWKERPIFGWGPENYIQIFDRHFNIKYFTPSQGFGAWFDRAHSVYFDYLATTGILGLLSFLSIFLVFYWQFFKFNLWSKINDQRQAIGNANLLTVNRELLVGNALIFALPVAYLVQGIVLFDVLPIYINIFLFLAFAVYKFNSKFQNSGK